MDQNLVDLWEQALADEGVKGTLLEQIARKTKGFESGGNSNAVSNRGATGWMQVMPATFKEVADQGWDINDPYFNARAGIRYLKKGWEASGGDPALTGAYYYGGPGGMEKARKGVAVSDPKNPNYPNTIQYGNRLAKAIEGLFPAANAGELPNNKGAHMNTPPQANNPINVNVKTTSSLLPNAMAAMLGAYGNAGFAGGEFRAQDASQLAPEAIASLQNMRETKARMLPVALGALMSSNTGANSFGQNMIGQAMSSLDPTKLNNGILTPDGQYITDVDGSSIMRSLLTAQKSGGEKTIPTGSLTDFDKELTGLSQFKSLFEGFKDSYTPLVPSETIGDVQNLVGKKVGLGYGDQAAFWMRYQELINAVRNRMFGSALTETERAEFEKAIVRPGMKPEFIRNALGYQTKLLSDSMNRKISLFSDSGYNTKGMQNSLQTVTSPQISNNNVTAGQGNGGVNVNVQTGPEASIDDLLKIYGN